MQERLVSMDDIKGISLILSEYSKEIQEAIEEEAQKIAKKGANKLKRTSPKNTGKYAKDWTMSAEKTYYGFQFIVHNKNHYQLTHLLENPHSLRNGNPSKPIPHIYPVEQEAIKEYNKKVAEIIGGIK